MLKKYSYSQFLDNPEENSWELSDLNLCKLNLIVGKNSAGKTRTVNTLQNLSKMMRSGTQMFNGFWKLEFILGLNNNLTYELEVVDKQVVLENIFLNKGQVLKRTSLKTEMRNDVGDEYVEISPPSNKLINVRRDEADFIFIKYLDEWAGSVTGLAFGIHVSTHEILEKPEDLVSLAAAASIVYDISPDAKKRLLKDFNKIGYKIIDIESRKAFNAQQEYKTLFFKESKIEHWIPQVEMSNGMFRALSLLIIINYFVDLKKERLIIVDDLAEGLDHETSSKLIEIIIKKIDKNSKVQFIATSNDYFLINKVDISFWNILIRNKTKVVAYNYSNSKDKFDDFHTSGLSNFNLFTSGCAE